MSPQGLNRAFTLRISSLKFLENVSTVQCLLHRFLKLLYIQLINNLKLQSKLPGKGLEDQLPTIAIVAHYDSFGLIPVSQLLFLCCSLCYVECLI